MCFQILNQTGQKCQPNDPTSNSNLQLLNTPSPSDHKSLSKVLPLNFYEKWAENESLLVSNLIIKGFHFFSATEHQEGMRNKPHNREE